MSINILKDYNINSYEKFDEALNIINSLDKCGLVSAAGNINKSASLPSGYSKISSGILNIKDQIARFANGDGPEKLIQNYKTGYNEIKNAIIDAYISEYEFALENGMINIDAESLRELGANGEETLKNNFKSLLNGMLEKNKNLQYLSLTEFFKELEQITGKYSIINNSEEYKDVFGNNVKFIEGYVDKTDVMPYTFLKPSNTNGDAKPLIVWLHGGGARQVKTYSESNYNLTHVISKSDLDNFDAYVISPVLTSSSDVWYEQDTVDKLSKLLDKFIAENNVDRNNIIICGGSAGGQGTLYMAKNMTDYFTQAVVLSGYGVQGINGQDIEIPIKGYVGSWDDENSKKYMKRLGTEIGEDKITYVSEASHGKLPRMLYNLDSDGNGKSDFIEDLFDSNVFHQKVVELNIKGTDSIYEKLNPNMSSSETISSNLQPKNNSDIAHRGHSPGGVYDNSAEAFKIAGERGFWGCEADVRFDKDGNLVCSHNAVKNGQNPPSFEEYLQICKDYGMTAIIDLKYEKGVGPADPYLSPAVLKVIEEKGMLDSCVIQTNNPPDVPYIRENSSEARIWYLTDVISDSNIEMIKENKVECVNIQNSNNNTNKSRISKLTDNGIDVCVWNVITETGKNNALNMGAKYVMSDNVLGITPYQAGEEDFNNMSGYDSNPDSSNLSVKEQDISDLSNTTPPGATAKPGTSGTTDVTPPGATAKPSTSDTTDVTPPGATAKPSTSGTTNVTPPGATAKPGTSGTTNVTPPGATAKPSTSGTTHVTPPGATAKPSTSGDSIISMNTENRLSHGLPSISEGTLGAMEISKSGVSYDVLNIDKEAYNDYLELLKKQGYTLNSSGVYTNGKYEVITTYSSNGSMNISLKILN